MKRFATTATVLTAASGVAVLGMSVPANAAPATSSAAAVRSSTGQADPPRTVDKKEPKKQKTKRIRNKIRVYRSAGSVKLGDKVRLTSRFHLPESRRVKFQYSKKPGQGKARKWNTIGKRTRSDGHGDAQKFWTPKNKGSFRVRALAPREEEVTVKGRTRELMLRTVSKSKPLQVGAKPAPNPPGPTPATWTLNANFPNKGYIDVPLNVPVQIKPAVFTGVEIQWYDSIDKVWVELNADGSSGATNTNGKATLQLLYGIAGSLNFRVAASNGAVSSPEVVSFDGNWLAAFYQPPSNAPTTPGKLIRTMTMAGTVPPSSLIERPLPPNVSQYRFLYTTMRYNPNTQASTPDVSSGMVMLPDPNSTPPKGYTNSNRPVVTWAHPTLGLNMPCAPSAGQEGYQTNYMDMSWFLSSGGAYLDVQGKTIGSNPGGLLADGYVVVMPDYLSVATPGLETYLVGQQEANDVIYAAKAIQAPASGSIAWEEGLAPPSTWPGANAGDDFVVAGHSQGGHAALWTGANVPLVQSQGLKLLGVAAAAPASDLNMTYGQVWDDINGWVEGPYAANTFIGYYGNSFAEFLTPQGQQALPTLSGMCLSEAAAYAQANFVNSQGQLTANFSQQPDPSNPSYAATWLQAFNEQTPILQGQQPQVPGLSTHAAFPKNLPLLLIQGQDDSTIQAQTNAAMQDTWCSTGATMDAYYTAVDPGAGLSLDGVPLPLMATHTTVLAWPIPDDLLVSIFSSPTGVVTPASTLSGWVNSRFLKAKPAVNCNAPWAPDSLGGTGSIHKMEPQGSCPSASPTKYVCNTGQTLFADQVPGQLGPFGANTQVNGAPKGIAFQGFQLNGWYAWQVGNQTGLAPFSTRIDTDTWTLQPQNDPNNPTGFIYNNAGPAGQTPWGQYPTNGMYFK